MKEKKHREIQHLSETRDLLVKQRSALKGKINNLLAAQGVNLKKEALSSKVGLERVLALAASAVVKDRITGAGGTDPQPEPQHCGGREVDRRGG